MPWMITRRATTEDKELLEKRARAFIERHKDELHRSYLRATPGSSVPWLELELGRLSLQDGYEEDNGGRYLWMLWKRVCVRALGDEGIHMGNVGHTV